MMIFRLVIAAFILFNSLSVFGASEFGSKASCVSCNRHSDSLELVRLFQFSGGNNWHNPWNLNDPLDTWLGVFLNSRGCVSFLNLRNNNLSGFLPNLNLPEVVFLELSDNKLVGSLPDFRHMEVLQTFSIANNLFAGSLPAIKNKFQLRTLNLSSNFFSGTLPMFTEMPNLRVLDLRRNQFTGNVHGFTALANLEELLLSENRLGGSLPNFTLSKLKVLDVSYNNLFGNIPVLNQLVDLELLNLSFNNFSGSVPNFPSLIRLRALMLNNNNLFGTLPFFNNMHGLRDRVWLHNNKLSGTIPNIAAWSQVEDINLNNNLFDSMAPMTNLLRVRTLAVANNKLTFNDLLPSKNIPLQSFQYAPQQPIGRDTVVFVPMGGNYTIRYNIDNEVLTNVYVWYKDDFYYTETTEPRLTINNMSFVDKGLYRVEATNPELPGLRIELSRTAVLLAGTSLNDFCQFAFDITDSTEVCNEFSFFDTSLDVAESSCGIAGDNVWFKFVSRGTRAFFYLDESTYDRMTMALYQFDNAPCSANTAEELACGDLINIENLIPGKEYYISVVGEGQNKNHRFTLCFLNNSVAIPPDNDRPCDAIGVAPTVCASGLTINATDDIINPNCIPSSSNSVWYKTRLSTGMNSLRINLANNTFFNDVSVLVGTFDNGCNGTFTVLPNGNFCGRPENIVLHGLQAGVEYYIQISTTAIGSGRFTMCLTEEGRTPRCAANITCAPGPDGPIEIPVFTRSQPSCYAGCNAGAPPGVNFSDNSCNSFYFPTVWYSFTTDERADFLTLSIRSNTLSKPQFAIYKSDDCQTFEPQYCRVEGNFKSDLRMVPVERNTRYYIAVTDFYGDVGFFNLCLATFENTSVCNTDKSLRAVATSKGSPLNGPFQPDEEVTFCYQVNHWQYVSCNWLQGIVPSFGPCWDPQSFDIVGQPRIINQLPRAFSQGAWRWFVWGEARYNVNNDLMGLRRNDPLPAGWYFINEGATPPPILTDPNTSFGDGVQCALDTLNWEICFTIKTRPIANCNEVANCNIGIKTYTDGEVGIRSRAACTGDVSTWFNATMDCCRNPETEPIANLIICSGEQISVPLIASDSLAEFNVSVLSAPGILGANGGKFAGEIRQTLVNQADTMNTVRYQVISESDGCLAIPITFDVKVYPKPDLELGTDQVICLGDSAVLAINLSGQGPFQVNYTANGLSQPPLTTTGNTFSIRKKIEPKIDTRYILSSVVGANGCTTIVNDSIIITVNPTSRALLETAICEGDTFRFEGISYTNSATFEHLYENANQYGCDSVVDVRLTVGKHYDIRLDTTICSGEVIAIGNNNFDKSGTYTNVLTTRLGCDSVIVLNLTVPPAIRISDTLIIHDSDKGNGIISVNVSGGIEPYRYRWSNGRTTPLIQNLTAGIYSLTITDELGCEAIFAFEVDNLNSTFANQIPGFYAKVLPVPQRVGGELILRMESNQVRELNMVLMDFSGRVIQNKPLKLVEGRFEERLIAPAPPGMYWIKLSDERGNSAYLKLITN